MKYWRNWWHIYFVYASTCARETWLVVEWAPISGYWNLFLFLLIFCSICSYSFLGFVKFLKYKDTSYISLTKLDYLLIDSDSKPVHFICGQAGSVLSVNFPLFRTHCYYYRCVCVLYTVCVKVPTVCTCVSTRNDQ